MFIFWKKRESLKNRPPRQRQWYEVSLYAYLRENIRNENGVSTPALNLYLGRIKMIGGTFTAVRRAVFYINVEKKLIEHNYPDQDRKKIVKLLDPTVPVPDEEIFNQTRRRLNEMEIKKA